MKAWVRGLLPERGVLWRDGMRTLFFLFAATALNFFMVGSIESESNVPEVYILSILFVSLTTHGHFWGLIACVLGVVGTNYFFTYPFFTVDFFQSGYPVTFISMLVVAVITGTMTTGLKEQRDLFRQREERTRQLNAIGRQLLSAQSSEQIAALAQECLCGLLGSPARLYLDAAESGGLPDCERRALCAAFETGRPVGMDMGAGAPPAACSSAYVPLVSGGRTLAVAAFPWREAELPAGERQDFLQLVLSQFSMALERQHLADERQQIVVEKQKERMRGNLLRAISHDLRTPLTGILGASSALLENGDRIDAVSRGRLLGDIREDAEWLLRMVENVLSVTRIGEGAPNLRKTPEPAEEVVAGAAERCRKRYPGIQLSLRAPDEFIMAPMDATLIEQVLINLIENARKHGAPPIEVSVSREGERAAFSVRDHGSGLAPDVIPALFEGFSTREGAGSDSARGLGIGLSICRSIITAHGGAITGDNAPAGGALFTFTLPMEEENHVNDG